MRQVGKVMQERWIFEFIHVKRPGDSTVCESGGRKSGASGDARSKNGGQVFLVCGVLVVIGVKTN